MRLATKDQYVSVLNEANEDTPGYVPKDPLRFVSTDWYQELVRTAPMSNHKPDISGIADKSNYSLGGSYLFRMA